MLIKVLSSALKVILAIFSLLVLLVVIFYIWITYTSPINEAGREFKDEIKSYQNDEIVGTEDVYERLSLLDTHFDSPTFSKMQGGEKTEVTVSDLQVLFGEPDEVIRDVDMSFVDTVYQYYYDDITINFHEAFDKIDEYVLEEFTENLYDPNTLDKFFVETVINHQLNSEKANEEFDPITEEMVSETTKDYIPTRQILQSGWHTWSLNRQYYFDDGQASYSPEEYISLQFSTQDEPRLNLMERRYRETFLKEDTPEEYEKKQEALLTFNDFYDSNDSNAPVEQLIVEDFSKELGDIARMIYDFKKGNLSISWLMNKKDESVYEITARIHLSDIENISDISDLDELKVLDYKRQILSITETALNTAAFIGTR